MGTQIAGRDVIERVRTLVVDDHPMFRVALEEFLARQPEFDVAPGAGSVAEAITRLEAQTFDLTIVDLVLPDSRGSAFVDRVLNMQPDCKVFGLSGVDEPTQIAEMLRAGASGFALKSQTPDEILESIRCVLAGGRSVPAAVRGQVDRLLDSPAAWPLERLTAREREVFDLLVGGYTNDDIAAKLVISRRTVQTHRFRIMTKLAARSLGDLLQLAMRHGVVARREPTSDDGDHHGSAC